MLQGILNFLVWSRLGRRCWVEQGCWWRSYGIAGKWVKQRHHGCPKGRLRVALVEDCHGRIHECCFQSSHTTREEVEGMLLLKAGSPSEVPARLYHRVSLFCSCLRLRCCPGSGRLGTERAAGPVTSCQDPCSEVFGRLASAKGLWHTRLAVPAATAGCPCQGC